MKHCSSCNQTKPVDEFYGNKTKKDGLHCHCKVCSKERKSKWVIQNREKAAAYDRQWQLNNKDKKSKNYKNWQVNNRSKVNSYNSYRRALEIQATPEWLTKEHKTYIQCKYSVAEMLSKETNNKYHVDHIVPLKGKTVCGLHVPWNLQVLKATDNLKKGNKQNAVL